VSGKVDEDEANQEGEFDGDLEDEDWVMEIGKEATNVSKDKIELCLTCYFNFGYLNKKFY
jgi:hypothetical protein